MRKVRLLFSAGFIALQIIAGGLAQPERAQVTLPEIERKSLLNGMQFLFFEEVGERAPFLLMIENGAAFDPSDKWGVTQVMVRMMLDSMEELRYLEEFRRRGIELEARVDWDAIYFLGSAPPAELDYALTTLAEVLVRPDFREGAFEKVRNSLLEEVRTAESDLDHRTQWLFQAAVFQDNPYGHPVHGTAATVANILFRDIKIQARRLLMPNQARLALHFSGDRENLFRRLSRRWGTWVRDTAAPFTFRQSSPLDRPRIFLVDTDGGEGLLRWGYRAVSRTSKDYFALKVLEQYLTLELPDWAEEVAATSQVKGQARFVARRMPGFLQISLTASAGAEAAYVAKLNAAMEQLRNGAVKENRFQEAKSLVWQEFLEGLENPAGRLMLVMLADLHGLGVHYLTTYGLRLERVTPEALRRTVGEVFPAEGYALVMAGKAAEVKPRLESLGTVEVLN